MDLAVGKLGAAIKWAEYRVCPSLMFGCVGGSYLSPIEERRDHHDVLALEAKPPHKPPPTRATVELMA